VTWDAATAAIHGKPPGYTPTLHEALGYFPPDDRARVAHAALTAFDSRSLFDIEAGMDVDGGIRVRLIGGRGYEIRDDAAELHGIIETLPPAPRLAGGTDESGSGSLGIAALMHELQGRISSVAAYTALAEREHGDVALSRKRLARIADVTAQMQRIVDAVAKLERGDAPEREPIDASAMAEAIVRAHVELNPHYARTEVTVAPGIELVGDPGEVALVLDNLVANALKFSAAQLHPRVQVTASANQGRTIVHVVDNGVGLEPEDAAEIFKLFTRRCPTAFEGTGVGLAIARRVVERHGGLIWAEGQPGGGATFSFYL
jgi:signal transduction histidine kinase